MDIPIKGKAFLRFTSDSEGNNYIFLVNSKVNLGEAISDFLKSIKREATFGKISGHSFVETGLSLEDTYTFTKWIRKSKHNKTPQISK